MRLFLWCFLLFAGFVLNAECGLQVSGSAFGNLEFGGKPQKINLLFLNQETFSGECQEIIRLTDPLGNDGWDHVEDFSMEPQLQRRVSVQIPAGWQGPFRIRYSILQQGKVLFSREIRGGNYSPVLRQDPDHAIPGCYVWGIGMQGAKTLPLLKNLGISWVRTIVNWNALEKRKGTFDFSALDQVFGLLSEMDFRILVNYEYVPDWMPRPFENPENWKIFAERAETLARRYPQVLVWEAWNEPDFKYEIFGKDSGKGFAEMLREFYPAVKRGNPNAFAAACGTASDDPERITDFLNSFFQNGGGKWMDLYTFHYSSARKVNLELLKKYHFSKPVWNTEDSIYDQHDPSWTRNAAGFVVHTASGAAEGVARTFYFLSYIPVNTAAAAEEFGKVRLFDNDFLPTPNLWVLQTLAKELNGFRFVSTLKMPAGIHAVLFENPLEKKNLTILWRTPEGPRELTLRNSDTLEIVNPFGQTESFSPEEGVSSISLDWPLFIHGKAEPAESLPMLSVVVPPSGFGFGELKFIELQLYNPGKNALRGVLETTGPAHWKIPSPVPVNLRPGERKTERVPVQTTALSDEMEFSLGFRLKSGRKLLAKTSFSGIMLPPLEGVMIPTLRFGEKRAVLHLTNRGSTAVSGKVLLDESSQSRDFVVLAGETVPIEFAPKISGFSGAVSLRLEAGDLVRTWNENLDWTSASETAAEVVSGKTPQSVLGTPLDPARWTLLTSAAHKRISFRNQSLEFSACFPPDCKDRWIYPVYTLTEKERSCRYLTFRIKAVQKPFRSGFTNVLLWFSGPGNLRTPDYHYKEIKSDFLTHTIDLRTKWNDALLPEKLHIGLCNRFDDEVAITLSELEFH